MSDDRPILAIEDNDEDFVALEHAFRAAGIKNPLQRCTNGSSAMQALLSTKGCPKADDAVLILLDLNLPGVDGRELLVKFRESADLRRIPVIIFSTSSHPSDVEWCYRCGANAYLVKPLALEEWEATIRDLCAFWLGKVTYVPAPRLV